MQSDGGKADGNRVLITFKGWVTFGSNNLKQAFPVAVD